MTMTLETNGSRRVLSQDEIDALMIEVEKGQQLAGHFPSAEALARARRILIGEMTLDEARAEILAKYAE